MFATPDEIMWLSIAIGICVTVVSLVVLYFVIFLAVRHALRSHSTWEAEEAAFARRTGGLGVR